MAGYLVQNQLEVSIFINDIEYPIGAINMLQSLHITTTVRGSVPMLSMQLVDAQRLMEQIGLKDGVPIRIVIKALGKNSKTYNFREFTHQRIQSGANYVYRIFGYWDVPIYWATSTAASKKGTSNDVISFIASQCGMKYDGTSSNDSQLWMPQNKLYRAWAKSVVEAGYVNDNSSMSLGLDLDNTLRYKDVNNLPAPEKSVIAYQLSKEAYTAVDFQITTSSGFNNALTGYQNMRYAQSSTADTTQEQIQNLVFKADVKSPLYNVSLKDKIGRGAVRFGPIDCGNVHTKYERAKYQNVRYANLFNLGLDLLMTMPTDIKLLEQINFSVQKEDTSIDTATSGIYTVTGHSIYIEAATYAERIGIVRHGTNEKPS